MLNSNSFLEQVLARSRGREPAESSVRRFPSWHYAMLNDASRSRAIEDAIRKLQPEGKTIFEIGAGTGLIAMLFAKHGAQHVYTCEADHQMFMVADRIIGQSGYKDQITLWNVPSSTAVEFLPTDRAPDIIFTETIDCGVIGEGFFSVSEDIVSIADSGTIILPQKIQQFGLLVESESIINLNRVREVCGFDLSILNEYSTRSYFPVHSRLHDFRLLSEPVLLRTYDYRADNEPQPAAIRCNRPGTAHGVLTWFSLHFGSEVVTNLIESGSHWHQAFHPLAEAIPVSTHQAAHLTLNNSGQVTMTLEDDHA
ncbi:MAG: protein methyltransferase [Proteobacteria bacterium]|nr:protein methyltransferase [Pseudomonadota bacterium]